MMSTSSQFRKLSTSFACLLNLVFAQTTTTVHEEKKSDQNSTNYMYEFSGPVNFQTLSLDQKRQFLDSIDTIVSDCDGVLWTPVGVINEANVAAEKLMARGKSLYFVTNNSLKTKTTLADEFRRLGFVGVTEDNVLCPAGLSAAYLRDNLKPGKWVYVVGPPSLREELDKFNIPCLGVGKDEAQEEKFQNLSSIDFDLRMDIGAVLVGYDVHISMVKIVKAATYLKMDKECLFVATNVDPTFPSGRDLVMPGAGSVVASIQVAAGRQPFVIGKPSAYISEVLKSKFDPKRTLFVGDRLESDILIGRKCDFRTMLVLTGTHNLQDVERYSNSTYVEHRLCIPHYYTNAFSDLVFE